MTRKMLKEEDEGESGQSTVVPSKALKSSLLLVRRELKSSEPIELFQFPGQVNLAYRCTIFLCHLDLEIYQLDNRHRHPNINIREIIWLGD